MDQTIGTCSICGGRVTAPNMMVNPVARCESCGATQAPHGPVIPMVPTMKPRTTSAWSTGTDTEAGGE